MWTERDIAEAIILGLFILSSPLIYIFLRVALRYMLNRYIPRDTVIEYKENGELISSYYIKRRLFKQCEYYRIDGNKAPQSEPA